MGFIDMMRGDGAAETEDAKIEVETLVMNKIADLGAY